MSGLPSTGVAVEHFGVTCVADGVNFFILFHFNLSFSRLTWPVVTILDNEGLEESGYPRSANKCPRVVDAMAGDQNCPC